jgi:nitrate reductase alpha subunit
MPNLVVVERDYGAVADKWAALGPLAEGQGALVKSAALRPEGEIGWLAARSLPGPARCSSSISPSCGGPSSR